jgi:hypothetical protein
MKMLGRPIVVAVALVTVLVFVPVSVAHSASSQRPGRGSTVTAWKHAYGKSDRGPGVLCTARNIYCFGAPVRNTDSGRTYQFAPVDFTAGIVDGYQENFPKGTSLATVEAALSRMLPKDVGAFAVVVDNNGGSCGLINLTSPTLGKELGNPKFGDPQGVIGIELQYIDANLDSVYSPSNVQTVSVGGLAYSPTDNC